MCPIFHFSVMLFRMFLEKRNVFEDQKRNYQKQQFASNCNHSNVINKTNFSYLRQSFLPAYST